jgi:ATP-binding cassette, subfamily C (CFTR/MRP), member 1
MGFHPLEWYCQPVQGGVWSQTVENALGMYTPCGTETVILGISHLALFGVCFYRTWQITKDLKVQRFSMKSKLYSYILMVFAAFCVAEPLFQVVMGYSIVNLDGQSSLAPFEVSNYTGLQHFTLFRQVLICITFLLW